MSHSIRTYHFFILVMVVIVLLARFGQRKANNVIPQYDPSYVIDQLEKIKQSQTEIGRLRYEKEIQNIFKNEMQHSDNINEVKNIISEALKSDGVRIEYQTDQITKFDYDQPLDDMPRHISQLNYNDTMVKTVLTELDYKYGVGSPWYDFELGNVYNYWMKKFPDQKYDIAEQINLFQNYHNQDNLFHPTTNSYNVKIPEELLSYYHKKHLGEIPFVVVNGLRVDTPLSEYFVDTSLVEELRIIPKPFAQQIFGARALHGYYNLKGVALPKSNDRHTNRKIYNELIALLDKNPVNTEAGRSTIFSRSKIMLDNLPEFKHEILTGFQNQLRPYGSQAEVYDFQLKNLIIETDTFSNPLFVPKTDHELDQNLQTILNQKWKVGKFEENGGLQLHGLGRFFKENYMGKTELLHQHINKWGATKGLKFCIDELADILFIQQC